MADIQGTNLAAGIVPFTTEDRFPTHYAEYGKGGWREVATVADRDAIPAERRSIGMIVYVQEDGKAYLLSGEDVWTEFNSAKELNPTDIPDLSDKYISTSKLGVAEGVATLDANGQVPATQLPSYVDDVVDLVTISTTAPAECAEGAKYYNSTEAKIYTATAANTWSETGEVPETGKIYVTTDTLLSYRWSGTVLVEIGADKLLGFNTVINGNGTTKEFTLTHGLGTRNTVVEIYENTVPYEKVYVNVLHTDTESIQVIFGQAPAEGVSYKVSIVAVTQQ